MKIVLSPSYNIREKPLYRYADFAQCERVATEEISKFRPVLACAQGNRPVDMIEKDDHLFPVPEKLEHANSGSEGTTKPGCREV